MDAPPEWLKISAGGGLQPCRAGSYVEVFLRIYATN
jgi:hypothetical protein